jgi:predicted hydrocarbon binding protein
MGKREAGMIEEISGKVERFAGHEAKNRFLEGFEAIAKTSNKRKIAKWVKNAIDRLDEMVDKETGVKIMKTCGYNCATVNIKVLERAKKRREKYVSIEKFLEAEQKNPPSGTRIEWRGDVLNHYYTPRAFTRPMKCYCSLLRSLPDDETVSLTYCHCSKGFVQKYWEKILGRPVKVELEQSTLSGADECKFVIHLK